MSFLKQSIITPTKLTLNFCKRQCKISVHDVAARGFNGNQEVYDRARPSYPSEAVNMLLSKCLGFTESSYHTNKDGSVSVLELGSGTGKFSQLGIKELVKQSYSKIKWTASEPAENMRQELTKTMAKITSQKALDEEKQIDVSIANCFSTNIDTIVPDYSQDAIFIAQAFHWFAHEESLQKIAKALKRKSDGRQGCLGLIWNLEDDTTPWVKELRNLYEVYDVNTPQYRLGLWRSVFNNPKGIPENKLRRIALFPEEVNSKFIETPSSFSPLEGHHFYWSMKQNSFNKIWERVLSKSYISILSSEEKEKLKKEIFSCLKHHFPEIDDPNAEVISYPYVTDIFWCHPN